ncbi:hypothetical protein SACT1_0748 [Streptomyces sp. ACT-1]|nr:hypothetical protein SACT1_0748 [Streptomyces sp. ACT-1]
MMNAPFASSMSAPAPLMAWLPEELMGWRPTGVPRVCGPFTLGSWKVDVLRPV